MEKKFQDLFGKAQDDNDKFEMAIQQYVHLKVVDKPMKKLVAMLRLRDEMLQLSEEMNERLKHIIERFGEESYDADTDQGLLKVELPEYMSCYNVDIEKL